MRLPADPRNGYAARCPAVRPSLNPKQRVFHAAVRGIRAGAPPGSSDIRRCAASTCCSPTRWASRAASASPWPNSKACTGTGLLLPASMFALDVLGGTVQCHRPRLRRRRRRPRLPADSRHARAGALARRAASHRCRSACTSMTARRSTAIRATCSATSLRRFARAGPAAGDGRRARVLPRRPRAHAGRPRAAAARSRCTGRREVKTQINSMQELDEYSAVLAAIDSAARDAGPARPARCSPNTARDSSKSTCTTWTTRCSPATTRSASSAWSRASRCSTAWKRPSCRSPTATQAGSGAHLHVSLLDAQRPQHLRGGGSGRQPSDCATRSAASPRP